MDALVGELEGGDITAGDRAHIAGDLLATCPAITDRERSILEWQTGWMLFCETGGRSARGIALTVSDSRACGTCCTRTRLVGLGIGWLKMKFVHLAFEYFHMHTLGGGPRVPTERAMCTARRSETKRHGVSDLAPLCSLHFGVDPAL